MLSSLRRHMALPAKVLLLASGMLWNICRVSAKVLFLLRLDLRKQWKMLTKLVFPSVTLTVMTCSETCPTCVRLTDLATSLVKAVSFLRAVAMCGEVTLRSGRPCRVWLPSEANARMKVLRLSSRCWLHLSK